MWWPGVVALEAESGREGEGRMAALQLGSAQRTRLLAVLLHADVGHLRLVPGHAGTAHELCRAHLGSRPARWRASGDIFLEWLPRLHFGRWRDPVWGPWFKARVGGRRPCARGHVRHRTDHVVEPGRRAGRPATTARRRSAEVRPVFRDDKLLRESWRIRNDVRRRRSHLGFTPAVSHEQSPRRPPHVASRSCARCSKTDAVQLTAGAHRLMRDVRARNDNTRVTDGQDGVDAEHRDDLDLALLQMRGETLARIDAALRRLDAGTYGICGDCDQPIAAERLRALPFAARCRACEEAREAAATPARSAIDEGLHVPRDRVRYAATDGRRDRGSSVCARRASTT